MTTATATVKTTVHITWTRAAKVRMTANVDMPEYGLTAGQTFYLVRSSEDNGLYYIVRWNYEQIEWTDGCKHSVERPNAKPCRHRRLVSDDCRARKEAKRAAASVLHQDIQEHLNKERKGITENERRLTAAGLMRR
jgi:hypothetical protein